MGVCAYCGRDAGWFSTAHGACGKKQTERGEIVDEIMGCLARGAPSPLADVALPVHLDSGERPIWFWSDVGRIEEKTRRSYVGGSSGFSVRLARGVTYRAGASRGTAVSESYDEKTDTGLLILSDQNIYFCGTRRTHKIALDSIIASGAADGLLWLDTSSRRYSFVPDLLRDAGDIVLLMRVVTGEAPAAPLISPASEETAALPPPADGPPEAGPGALSPPQPAAIWPSPGLARALALLHAVPTGLIGALVAAATAQGKFTLGQWLAMVVVTLASLSLLLALPALFHPDARAYAKRALRWSALALAFGIVLVGANPTPAGTAPGPAVSTPARPPSRQ